MKKIFVFFLMGILLMSAWSVDARPQPIKADHIVIYKSTRTLQLLKHGRVMREYRVALGKNPVGHKIHRGDSRTPEGNYHLSWRNPNSDYHLSLNVSYPDDVDKQVASDLGLNPGDMIMIHGLPNGITARQIGHPYKDWTDGCIAVTDREIEEIWQHVDDGTPISIWP